MDIKVSIIVPIYNVRDRILNTLKSIKNQSFKDFEVLFIDDGSPDDSSKIANEYLKNTHVNYRIIKKENGGVSSARNLGINEAKGEYITFLDSDDYIESNMIEIFFEKAAKEKCDVIYSAYVFEECDGRTITDNTCSIVNMNMSGIEAAIGLANGMKYTHIMANMFRRSILLNNNVLFDENRKFAEDISFMIKAYGHSKKVCSIEGVYAHYVKWDTSVMNNVSINYLDVYYSNIETLKYVREVFENKDLEKALVESRIPAGIVNIFAAFAGKEELHKKLYEFIKTKKVRNDLSKYKMAKIEVDRLKYYILSKIILFTPKIAERYYNKTK